jgi:hypothetical protein
VLQGVPLERVKAGAMHNPIKASIKQINYQNLTNIKREKQKNPIK